MFNINWKFVVDKVGTVIVDRRFWVAFFSMVVLVFGSSVMLEDVDSLSDEAVDISVLISRFLGVVVVPILLNNSWTKRAPSGLNFKGEQSGMDAFVEELRNMTKDS